MTDVKGPLHGIRVIDLGRSHQAAPLVCAGTSARLGPKSLRSSAWAAGPALPCAVGAQTERRPGAVRSGKKSLSLDNYVAGVRLAPPGENFRCPGANARPGTIDDMGFGYKVLLELNPGIMTPVSAYGQFGPYRKQIGYDPIGPDPCRALPWSRVRKACRPALVSPSLTAPRRCTCALSTAPPGTISGEGQTLDVPSLTQDTASLILSLPIPPPPPPPPPPLWLHPGPVIGSDGDFGQAVS